MSALLNPVCHCYTGYVVPGPLDCIVWKPFVLIPKIVEIHSTSYTIHVYTWFNTIHSSDLLLFKNRSQKNTSSIHCSSPVECAVSVLHVALKQDQTTIYLASDSNPYFSFTTDWSGVKHTLATLLITCGYTASSSRPAAGTLCAYL